MEKEKEKERERRKKKGIEESITKPFTLMNESEATKQGIKKGRGERREGWKGGSSHTLKVTKE